MKIGNIEIKNKAFLGPMAGFTDLPLRKISKEFGAGLTYTEMVSAKALYYGDKKTQRLLVPEDDKCAVQIFGRDPEIMAQISKKLEDMGVPLIDINMGCPAPKIVKNGEGSELLKEKELAAEIVYAIKKAVNIPVTVKTRRGWTECPDAVLELAEKLNEVDVDAICVHGRTREQYYNGKADWNIIKEVKKLVKCPVIGNGDVATLEDYVNIIEQTDCDAVMIARAACNRPWIFEECATGHVKNMSIEDKLRLILKHYELSVDFYGEQLAIPQMRKQFHCYIRGLPRAAKLKDDINKINSYEQVKHMINDLLDII